MKIFKIVISGFIFLLMAMNCFGQKNSIQIAAGIGGSDSFDPQFVYEVGYKRELSNKFSLVVCYSDISGDEGNRVSDLKIYKDANLIDLKNESTTPINRRSSMKALNIGLQFDVIRLVRSKLFLTGSLRYQRNDHTQLISSSSITVENFIVSFTEENTLGVEFGIGYERRFNSTHSLGGKFVLSPKTLYFGASLTAGAYF